MQRPDLKNKKIKRILLVYRELERMKVTHEGSMEIMEYVFGIGARWMEEILRKHTLDEFGGVKLEHEDVDLAMVDQFVNKMRRQAKKERTEQMNLFN